MSNAPTEPKPGHTSLSFTCAYWDFLRGHRAEPIPTDHGLLESMAKVIRIQCDIEFRAVGGKRQ